MAERYTRDRGLTVRMVAVMVYLAVVFAAAIAGVIVVLHGWGVALSVFALLVLIFTWFASGPVSLRAIGARQVAPADAPGLHGALDRLCVLSGVPRPRIAVMRSREPNAFALGRSPKYAVIVVTEPLVALLDADELESVLAHELAHLAHRDLLVMTVASSPGILASGLGNALRDGGLGRSAPFVLVAWIFTGLVHLICFLPARLLSRYRELCSDVAAAHLTQRPEALASALQKISGGITPIPTADLRSHAVVEVFGIVSAEGRSTGGWTSTHPSLDRRMAQLARVGAQLGRPGS